MTYTLRKSTLSALAIATNDWYERPSCTVHAGVYRSMNIPLFSFFMLAGDLAFVDVEPLWDRLHACWPAAVPARRFAAQPAGRPAARLYGTSLPGPHQQQPATPRMRRGALRD